VRLSGRWITTAGALSRFLRAQQPEAQGGEVSQPAAKPLSRSRRQRHAEAAQRELRRAGI
jgi:hypothetical protein